jgi:uncharacterized protein YybS (DUF2232 family)
MNQKQWKTSYFLYLGSYLLLLLMAAFVPLFSLLAVFFLPIPIVLLYVHFRGTHFYIGSLIIIVVSVVIAPLISIPLTVIALLSGIFIANSITKKHHPYETWSKGTLGYLLGFVAVYAYIELILGVSIKEMYIDAMDDSLKMTEELMGTVGVFQFSLEEMNLIREQMMAFLQLIPIVLVAVAMCFAILTQWLTYKWLNRSAKEAYRFPPFRNFQLPKLILWIYFLTLLLSIMTVNTENATVNMAILNVSHLAGILLVLQGLSFIFHYSYVKKQSKALPIVSIVILVFFPMLGLYLMRILGIIDLGFELKKRISK